jgi:hypothetical protein
MKTITNTALMGLAMLVPVAVSAQFLAVLTVLSSEPESVKSEETRVRKVAAPPSSKRSRAFRFDRFVPASVVL